MTYASTAYSNPGVPLPHVAMPKLRWPRLSPRARALMMIGVMISPTFLADPFGHCVQRLFYTADQIAAKQVPDNTVLRQVNIFHVACADTDLPAAEQRRWAAFAAQRGWPLYPQAGPTCVNPDRALLGVVGLKSFNVACPAMVLSVADQRRWIGYAANHGWTEYPQAGDGCVDP
jgi:hypothetical protein